MSRHLLLSVRPRFAHALLAGTKTAEIRRRFPHLAEGTIVAIYSSSPEKAVLGTMRVRRFKRGSADTIWRNHSEDIGIDEEELVDYLEGAAEGTVIELGEPRPWDNPIRLDQLRRDLELEPAQSFRYLNPRQFARLLELAERHADVPSSVRVESLLIPA